ncbi:MAG: DUF1800 domain-containing protein [Armatimonadetes bacterium]|nr:DUF1800 domain-containing protein [Armatimonadota bacterium]
MGSALLGARNAPARPAVQNSSAVATLSAMPYRAAGLTDRQAAAHLLDRFAYGARPGEVDRVVAMGLDRWLEGQLSAQLPDAELQDRLAPLKSLTMTSREIAQVYPQMNVLRNAAIREGVITQAEYRDNPQEVRRKLREFALAKGYRPPQEMVTELTAQKLLRAVYSENQLQEVLTDFWFNHFNVSLTDGQACPLVPSYERDAIRPHVLGSFRAMVGATAKHPAMLYYLDNAQSNAPAGSPTLIQQARMQRNARRMPGNARRNPRQAARQQRRAAMRIGTPNVQESGEAMQADGEAMQADGGAMEAMKESGEAMEAANPAMTPNVQPPMPNAQRPPRPRPAQRGRRGINENYARELMELHTLGVDGGYTQKDIIEVARTLTGWTIYPQGPQAEPLRRRLEREGEESGFVQAGDFLFRPDVHDAGEKTILGAKFPAGSGMEEGERVLDMLARHPSTAAFIARKFAVRFVSDAPPKTLVDRLAKTFLNSDGDVKAMVRTLAASPEFWSQEARRAKIKSPFELVSSSLRALNADVRPTPPLMQFMARMAQPLYAYQPPTGFPDRATAWVNTGSLLTRMNFGLQVASGRIPGVKIDLAALNGNREPESAEAALKTYAALLMPERDLAETLRQLTPMIRDPELAEKVDRAAPQPEADAPAAMERAESPSPAMEERPMRRPGMNRRGMGRRNGNNGPPPAPTMTAHVVGVLLGSPEFQRR